MKEIEFRGKRIDNGEWVYGYYLKCNVEFQGGEKPDLKPFDFILPFGADETDEWHEVEPETVGQFTGLKDKNGNEIYEGDIVEWDDAIKIEKKERIRRAQVIWTHGQYGFEILKTSPTHRPEYVFEIGSFAYSRTDLHLNIIGNIHDNPELLDQ